MTGRYKSSVRAFTLIELLVVVGIIGILTSILLSAIGNAKNEATQAKSLSNLRQIAAAATMFAADNNGTMPTGYFYQSGKGEVTYASQLAMYVGGTNTRIFVSPTSAIIPVKAASAGSFAITYSVNNNVSPDISNGGSPLRITSITRPSDVIFIADGAQSPTTTYSRSSFEYPTVSTGQALDVVIPVGPDADTTSGAGWLRYRAADGAVDAVMVDGHAVAMKKGTVCYRNIVAIP